MFPQFKTIKETSVAFTINKMIQGSVGNVDGFKTSDAVGTPIHHGSADGMVLIPYIDVFLPSIVVVIIPKDRNA